MQQRLKKNKRQCYGDGIKIPSTRMLFFLLVGVAGLLQCGILTNGHDWGDDFSAYIMQAQSLVEGTTRSFIEANRFTVENHPSMGPVAYPWGFPALLAPFYAAFGLNMIALKLVGVLSFLLFLLLLWFGFRKYHSHFWFLGLVGLFSLNPTLLGFSNQILSDIPFLLVSTFSILLMGILIVEGSHINSPVCDNILLGASIAGAFFIRTNGILLLVTLGITQFIALSQRRRQVEDRNLTNNRCPGSFKRLLSPSSIHVRSLCVNLAPYASFFCIVLAWEMVLPEGGKSYTALLGSISLGLIKHHLLYYLAIPDEFFSGVPHNHLFWGASIPIAIAGAIRRYRSNYHMIVYVLLTFLLYILWPPTQGFRFLLPVMPFYSSFLLTGLEALQGGKTEAEQTFRKMVCLLPILLLLSYFGMHSISGAYENLIHNRETSSGPFTSTSTSMFSFIKQNTEATSIVIFFKPRVMRMLTGRRSLRIDSLEQLSRGDYLCLGLSAGTDNKMFNKVSPDAIIQLSEQGAAQSIYENSEFRVYRLTKNHKESHNNALHTGGDSAALHPRR